MRHPAIVLMCHTKFTVVHDQEQHMTEGSTLSTLPIANVNHIVTRVNSKELLRHHRFRAWEMSRRGSESDQVVLVIDTTVA